MVTRMLFLLMQLVFREVVVGDYIEMHEASGSTVSAGHFHTCALRRRSSGAKVVLPPSDSYDDDYYEGTEEDFEFGGICDCWGFDGHAQASPPGEVMIQVSSGHLQSCGLNVNGFIHCWGRTGGPPLGFYQQVTCGNLHSCGLTKDGEARCWGEDHLTGATKPPQAARFAQLSAGLDFSCGIYSNNRTATCWGSNLLGQTKAPETQTFVQIAASSSSKHACGITWPDKHLRCWGQNTKGEAPAFLSGPFSQLALGYRTTCVLSPSGDNKEQGSLRCFGVNKHIAQQAPPGLDWIQISLGRDHLCGLLSDGAVKCVPDTGLFASATVPAGFFAF